MAIRAFTQMGVGTHTGVHPCPTLQLGLDRERVRHYHSHQDRASWRRTCVNARWAGAPASFPNPSL